MFGASFGPPGAGVTDPYSAAAGYAAPGPGYGGPYGSGYSMSMPGYEAGPAGYTQRSMADVAGARGVPGAYGGMSQRQASQQHLAPGPEGKQPLASAAAAAAAGMSGGPRGSYADLQQPPSMPQQLMMTSPALGGFPEAGQQPRGNPSGGSSARGAAADSAGSFPLSQGFLSRGAPGSHQAPCASHNHAYNYNAPGGAAGTQAGGGLAGRGSLATAGLPGMGLGAGSRPGNMPDLSVPPSTSGLAPRGYGSGYAAMDGAGAGAGAGAGQLGRSGELHGSAGPYRLDLSYGSMHGPPHAAGRPGAAAAAGYGSYAPPASGSMPAGEGQGQGRQQAGKEGSDWESSRYRGSMRQGLMAGLAGGSAEEFGGDADAGGQKAAPQGGAGQWQAGRQSDLAPSGDQYRQYMYGRPMGQ
jgi:hypothetical protein